MASFFGLLKQEVYDSRVFQSFEELEWTINEQL